MPPAHPQIIHRVRTVYQQAAKDKNKCASLRSRLRRSLLAWPCLRRMARLSRCQCSRDRARAPFFVAPFPPLVRCRGQFTPFPPSTAKRIRALRVSTLYSSPGLPAVGLSAAKNTGGSRATAKGGHPPMFYPPQDEKPHPPIVARHPPYHMGGPALCCYHLICH